MSLALDRPASAPREVALRHQLLALARDTWMAPLVAARPDFAETRSQLETIAGAYRSSL